MMIKAPSPLLLLLLLFTTTYAYTNTNLARRTWLKQAAATALVIPEMANASGGATAGKYTTIPIAKRRYYGRVQQAVHEFLEMGPVVVKADMTDPMIQKFFDTEVIFVCVCVCDFCVIFVCWCFEVCDFDIGSYLDRFFLFAFINGLLVL